MFICHESDHYQKEKLVVSPAVNQVVQSLSVRLLRVSIICVVHFAVSIFLRDLAAVSIVFVGAAPARATLPLPVHPPVGRGSLYAPVPSH